MECACLFHTSRTDIASCVALRRFVLKAISLAQPLSLPVVLRMSGNEWTRGPDTKGEAWLNGATKCAWMTCEERSVEAEWIKHDGKEFEITSEKENEQSRVGTSVTTITSK